MLSQHQPQQWLSACLLLCLLFTLPTQVANKEQFKQQVCGHLAKGKPFINGLGFFPPDRFVLLTDANEMVQVKQNAAVHLDLSGVVNVTVLKEDISSWSKIVTMQMPDGKKYLIGQAAPFKQDLSVFELGSSHAKRSVHTLDTKFDAEFGKVWLSSSVNQIFYALTDQKIIKLHLFFDQSLKSPNGPNYFTIGKLSQLWICQTNSTHLTLQQDSCVSTDWAVLNQVTTGLVKEPQVYLLTRTSVYAFSIVDFEKDTPVTVPFSMISCEQFFGCSTAHTSVSTVISIGVSSASTKSSGCLPCVIIPVVVVLVGIAVALVYFYCDSVGKSQKKKKKSAGSQGKVASADQLKGSVISSKQFASSSHVNKFNSAAKVSQEKQRQSGKMSLKMKLKSSLPNVKAPTMMDSNFGKLLNSKFIIDVDVSVPNSTDISMGEFEKNFSKKHPKPKGAKGSASRFKQSAPKQKHDGGHGKARSKK